MRRLSVGLLRQAVIWQGALPDARYAPEEVVTTTVPGLASAGRSPASAAVELYVPAGGRFHYGLVGGTFTGEPSSQFRLDTYLASDPGRPFASGICRPPLTDLHVGLLHEDGEAAEPAVRLAMAQMDGRPLAAGRLVVDCAVHSDIGSSRTLYKHLIAILIRILATLDEPVSDEQLMGLFPATYE